MEFNKNEAAILAGSTTVAAAGPSGGEIDLYDELIAFAGLSPEEQQRSLIRPKKAVEEAVEPPYSDSARTNTTSNAVGIETTAPQPGSSLSGSPALLSLTAAQSPPDPEDFTANGKTSGVSPQLFDRSRTGPLLAGLSAFADFVFAGDLSLGVCLACGAESGADDLFCVSCGVFIDEIGSTPKSNPTCGECGQSITADEIFCPWCGAAPAA